MELLSESQRPLIYAGGGVINGEASAALTEFAVALNIPVVTTLMGIGSLDTDASAVACACSACTGWPPPITPSRIATS